MKPGAIATSAAPSIGPAIVTVAGLNVPILALALSVAALLLARYIAPPSLEKMTKRQEIALTALLMIVLFLVVTGEMPLVGSGEPLGAGLSVVWGVGLGLSGMMVIRVFRDRAIAMFRAAMGNPPPANPE